MNEKDTGHTNLCSFYLPVNVITDTVTWHASHYYDMPCHGGTCVHAYVRAGTYQLLAGLQRGLDDVTALHKSVSIISRNEADHDSFTGWSQEWLDLRESTLCMCA